jgi:ABC-2 type transport system permease protein
MTHSTYLRYELLRSFRNKRFLILSLAFPLVLFLLVGGTHRHDMFNGISFPLNFMAAMATLGTMAAMLSSAGTIAADRATGWMRQMRITPLTDRAYFGAKVSSAYSRAVLTMVVLGLAGVALGVHLGVSGWLTLIGLLLVGLIPFALMGIVLGHVVGNDASAPAVGGLVTLFALLGGVYGFQIATKGPMFDFIRLLPSYWLVQAGKTALHGGSWALEGWIVMAVWTAALIPLALVTYRRDTDRV